MIVDKFDLVVEQFKEGNYTAIRSLKRILNSALYISEDENIIFMSFIIVTVGDKFYEDLDKVEGGKEFLGKLALILEKIKNAFKEKNEEQLVRNLKKFVVMVNNQVAKIPELNKI